MSSWALHIVTTVSFFDALYLSLINSHSSPSFRQIPADDSINGNRSSIIPLLLHSFLSYSGLIDTEIFRSKSTDSIVSTKRGTNVTQTDLEELIAKIDSIPMEATKAALKELDEAINHIVQEAPITPNDQVNVIIVNPSVTPEVVTREKPLIQRLFEGKMIKLDRRGHKQHVRILCLTSERVYIITKSNPYPKEALLFNDILGISCTPHKHGFICLHTREGDWIFVVDHPCEFITQLFMAMGKNENNNQFLQIKTSFKHTRRNIVTVTDECMIEVRPSDTFHLAFENTKLLTFVL